MVWLNGAHIALQEQAAITGHLSTNHLADARTRMIEHGMPTLLATLARVVSTGLRRRRAARHARRGVATP